MTKLWLRNETRDIESRTPITPADARMLIERSIAITVEDCPKRTFATEEYAAAGCAIAPAGSWVDAPADQVIVGLKELPELPEKLVHRHVFFGHAYKGQPGARALLDRFAAGGGTLLDLEYLVDDSGRRLAAFGYWAGYVGAALAVLHAAGKLPTPLAPMGKSDLDDRLRAAHAESGLVIGALGRCGRGAVDALTTAGVPATAWDLAETRNLDRAAIQRHQLLINAVFSSGPAEPFLTRSEIGQPGSALRVIADVTCDVGSAANTLPIYDDITTWRDPARRLHDDPVLDIIAIDNLPTLLPRESSTAFSAELRDHLLTIDEPDSPWARCATLFREATHG
ncbi:saccharopine dehydrogenase [Pseudonocardiaceae bacterium YIM PH 21723]|nr:saccharopine dehydrogenase [Pseudonocardiaceae bacterium YIM PH 21723]